MIRGKIVVMQSSLLILTVTSLSLLAGAYYGNRTKRNPELFWTYLIIGLIFTSPLMVGGYTWYDELFAAAFLLTNLSKNIKISAKASHKVFMLFCMYMFFQSFRGIAFFSHYGLVAAITKTRWIVFFIIIFLVFAKSTSAKINSVFDKDLPYKLTKAGLIFNFIYLSYGLISIYITGSTAFTQTAMLSDEYRAGTSPLLAIFGSTGYVASLFIVFIPAALITIKNDARARVNIAWLTLALSLMTQMLYNSRSGMLIILIFLSLFILQYGSRPRVVKGFLSFIPLIGLGLLFQVYFNEIPIELIFQDMLNTLHLSEVGSYNPDLQDIDRRVWNLSAMLALTDNAFNLLFGWGLRTSGYIVAPYVYDLFREARGTAIYSEDVGTPGFAALAVDSGTIGLLLIAVVLIFCIVQIYKKSERVQLFLLFAPLAFILQLFVMNIFDVLLLYLAIMPCGLYVVLAQCNLKHTNSSLPGKYFAKATN
jgi:uncharacterized membrane protein